MKSSFPAALMFTFITIALALLFIVPFSIPNGDVIELDGTISFMDHWNLWNGMNPITGSVYAIGDILCHQMESRSIFINGNQMPLCSRDVSILLGLASGLAAFFAARRHIAASKRLWIASLILIVPMIADWVLQYATFFDSAASRMVTGFLAGLGFSMMFYIAVQRMSDGVRRNSDL